MIVAIDGPAGSGKSTVARTLARTCGFAYLDTGAMYRSVALVALEAGIDLRDEAALEKAACATEVRFARSQEGEQAVYLGERDITLAIRTPEVDDAVSLVAKVPAVRRVMVERQRAMAQGADVVAEGRDIGTVVFPHADVKVYLTASEEARAARRCEQNRVRMGQEVPREAVDAQAVRRALAERDHQDSSRAVAPLSAAPDAVTIDSSALAADEVVARVEALVAAARAAAGVR